MARTIAVVNQKGGVGKSTTALALGAGLRKHGSCVLFVDLDAQGNLSHTLGAEEGEARNAFAVLEKQITAQEAVTRLAEGDLIASSSSLAGADVALQAIGKEYRLRDALLPLQELYDAIIIDTPPSLGILTVNALTAADEALIPAQADLYSLQGIRQLGSTIDAVRAYCNPQLALAGILLTRYNPRAVLSRDLAEFIEQAARSLGTRLFRTTIREGIAVKEAQTQRTNLFAYAPRAGATQDYEEFILEYLGAEGAHHG